MTPDQIFIGLGFLAGLGVCGWLLWQWRRQEPPSIYFDRSLADAIRRAEKRRKRGGGRR